MSKTKMPKSRKKFIRHEKARIRKEVLDFKRQRELIDQLYKPLEKEKEQVKEPEKKEVKNKKSKKQTVKSK